MEYEDKNPLGMDLKDSIVQKKPNQAESMFSHCLWRVLLGIFHPLNHSLVRSQRELNASLQNRA